MTLKEIEEKLVTTLKKWQKIEEEAIISTGEVIAEMKNPLPRAIFEIIQRDAENHRRVLELIVQSHEKEGFKLTVDQLEEVSKVVSRHVQVEKRMIESARRSCS